MFRYTMSPTGRAFHESDAFVKMGLGPFGSGKSCFTSVDVLTYICAQAPAPNGVRYSRVGVIRATYPELSSMTRKSLMEVFPMDCGHITSVGAPLKGTFNFNLDDGTKVHTELELFALKTVDDIEKIRSANWTFAWINEATGVAFDVFDAVLNRVSRYPSLSMGGISYGGVLMDFNMPETGSWLDMIIKDLPLSYALFKQPPAVLKVQDLVGNVSYVVNDNAENLRNLGSHEEGDPDEFYSQEEYDEYLLFKGKRYYQHQVDALLRVGRTDKIDNLYCMLDVPIVDGKPVYASFNKERHVSKTEITPVMFQDIIIGVDQSGIHPAAVIMQNIHGKWCIIDELYADGEGLENFLHGMLIPLLRSRYSTNPVSAALDPSNAKDSWTATTPKVRFEEAGIPAVTEITNSPRARIQIVDHMLNLEIGG